MTLTTKNRRLFATATLLIASAVGVAIGDRSGYLAGVLMIAAYFAAFSLAWDIVYGVAGQIHFAPSLFIATGGYCSGLLSIYGGLHPLMCILIGTLVAVMLGIALTYPALRVNGPFLGLVTLAAVLLMEALLLVFAEFTGGVRGRLVPSFISVSDNVNFLLAMGVLGIAVIIREVIETSKVGLVLKALSESAREVEVIGLSAARYKALVFVINAGISGLGGGLLVFSLGSMSPSLLLAVPVLMNIVIGGIIFGSGSVYGPVLGGALLVVIAEMGRGLGEYQSIVVTTIFWVYICLGYKVMLRQR